MPPQAQPNPPHLVAGTRADAKLASGGHDGFRVDIDCSERDCFGIVGTGAHWYPGMERERINEDARFRAGFEKLRC